MKKLYKKVAKHLFKSKSVAIFVHVNPDWDCIGSALALRSALRSKGIKSDVFTDAPLSYHLSFMESDVIVFDESESMPDYECFCAIDVGAVSRLGKWGEFFSQKENTVCIDHHLPTGDFAALNIIDYKRSSTGELVYEVLSSIHFKITKEIASYIYCAISSDTGSLQYSNVNKRTYEILIELSKADISTSYLCSMLYERKTLSQLKLEGEAIDSIKLYGSGKIATAFISNATLEKYGATREDTHALASLPRMIDGVMLSAFFSQLEDGSVRVNLRSLGDYNIEGVARLFGGGGHKKAAGCTFEDTDIETAEKKVVEELIKL